MVHLEMGMGYYFHIEERRMVRGAVRKAKTKRGGGYENNIQVDGDDGDHVDGLAGGGLDDECLEFCNWWLRACGRKRLVGHVHRELVGLRCRCRGTMEQRRDRHREFLCGGGGFFDRHGQRQSQRRRLTFPVE